VLKRTVFASYGAWSKAETFKSQQTFKQYVEVTQVVNIVSCRESTQLTCGLFSEAYSLYRLLRMHNIIFP
jgi:hypothetical protein